MRLENSFSIIPGFGEKTEKKLWKNDVTHWDDIEGCSQLSSRKVEKADHFIEKAKKNLEVGNTRFFGSQLDSKRLWRIYRNFEQKACFFDIETTGLDRKSSEVTTVSFYRNGETETLVQGRDLTSERLKEMFYRSDVFVSFNGKRFDQPFIEHNFEVEMDKPHIDLMYLCNRLGLSGGLKKVEKQIGIERELEDIDGREAVRLWKQYQKGDRRALEKLVKYNRYDAKNLQQLLEHVHKALTREVFRPHLE